jgi:hypothetical protein
VKGKVEQTFPYCGGAKPTKEIVDECNTSKPFANKVFYLRNRKLNTRTNNIIKTFTTDSLGNFSLKIRQGSYSIIVEEQLKDIKSEDCRERLVVTTNRGRGTETLAVV